MNIDFKQALVCPVLRLMYTKYGNAQSSVLRSGWERADRNFDEAPGPGAGTGDLEDPAHRPGDLEEPAHGPGDFEDPTPSTGDLEEPAQKEPSTGDETTFGVLALDVSAIVYCTRTFVEHRLV